MPKFNTNKDKTKNMIMHPNSRKTAKIAKKNVKANTREKSKLASQVKLNLLGEKVMWFKEHCTPDVKIHSPQVTLDIIELYLHRFDDELEQINLKHSIGQRKGRQHASREDIIRLTLTHEREEFETCGLECPDLMNVPQVELLQKWEGELRYLQNFKLRRFSKSALLKEVAKLENNSTTIKRHKKAKKPSSSAAPKDDVNDVPSTSVAMDTS